MGSVEHAPPKAVDLSHHLNAHSKARHPSPLKEIIKFMGYEGMVSLAGGLPHPSLFPFQGASIQTYPQSIVLDTENPAHEISKIDEISLVKNSQAADVLSLSTALQYGSGTGDPLLRKWAYDFTQTIFEPAYADFDILLNSGNTDAWCKVVRMLCEPGDVILVEENTYPSSQALWIPMGCKAIPVKMDSEGMRADSLRDILESWNSTHPNVNQPHLVYIVPVGSNPTGTTMQAQRRKDIYDLCVQYDIIICEDDPYSFLQYPSYAIGTVAAVESTSSKDFLASLAPSFLKYDTQGRVIRLDTFSKTLAPGNRLGYFVVSPIFWERLLRATEVETQAPSGWSQAIIYTLLNKWGINGYVEWLATLRGQYQTRRNWLCDAFAENFEVQEADPTRVPGAEGLVAYSKGSKPTPIFSFVPPTGGMFIWTRWYFAECPRFKELQKDASLPDPEQTFADELWAALAKNLVLLTPGSYYTPWQGSDKTTTKARGGEPGIGHFRIAFSTPTKQEMEIGIQRMAAVLEAFWA